MRKKCPVDAIINSKESPYWTFDCESCMHCMNYCPERAIETTLSFTVLLWWLAFSILPLAFFNFMVNPNLLGIARDSLMATLLFYFVKIAGGLFIIYLAYHLLHYLMRFRVFSKLITFTSHTKYTFWRRYRAPK